MYSNRLVMVRFLPWSKESHKIILQILGDGYEICDYWYVGNKDVAPY